MIPAENLGQAFLGLLAARGVDCLFANPGTEFTSIIDGLARGRAEGFPTPRPITVAHEFGGVGMAHGYYLQTGRPQAVMVHATIGAACALGGIMNASRLNVPVFFIAGRTAVTERDRRGHRDKFIHWAQESYDQGAALREYVRWDYEVRDAATLEAAVDRGLAMAMRHPRGPIYLIVPREILLETCPQGLPGPGVEPPTPPAPDPTALDDVCDWLQKSQRPLIITNRSGVDVEAAGLLDEVAERFGIAVVTPNAHYAEIPKNHPLNAGHDAVPWIADADLVIVLDVDVPWCPVDAEPTARVVSVGADPLHGAIPMRGHRADLHLTATPRAFLEALLQALPRTQTDAWRARVGESARARERALSERLNALSAAARIDPSWVAACLAEALGPDDVVVNELSLPAAPLAMQPGSYFRSGPASCLGWGLNAALGIRLASPQKTVVAVLGDGAYLFANPAAAHQTAAAHGIATLTIVLNNEEMGSIREQVSRYHPGGWADRAADYPLTQLPGLSHVERIVEAFGGHGESVQAPGALPDALRRCLRLVREGRQVVLNVRI